MEKNNSMAQLFWGRVLIEEASAMYYFEKGGKCRKIIHQIKYKGHPELARYLGNIYGTELSLMGKYANTDILIPVPLHQSRQKQRGFNQSEWFARGLADSLGKTVMTGVLVRFLGSGTQTNKSRIERWENVKNNFRVKFPERIENKHILLVDDIATTGATLESCASVLLKNNGVKVSIITLAFA
ncbi:MAG: ComF family protein [Cyclobacteriaceae bacterium]